MKASSLYRAVVFGLTAIGGSAGHQGGDYPVQSDRCARFKQQRSASGRRALAVHGLTYGLTEFATKSVVYAAAGVRVPLWAQLAGQATEIVLHVAIDDGRLLRALAYGTGTGAFHELGAPRSITGVVEVGDGDLRPVRLVAAERDADGRRVPVIDRDARGEVVEAAALWDNPTPSTGRALLDQALHTWVQVLAGAAVTTTVACWLRGKG